MTGHSETVQLYSLSSSTPSKQQEQQVNEPLHNSTTINTCSDTKKRTKDVRFSFEMTAAEPPAWRRMDTGDEHHHDHSVQEEEEEREQQQLWIPQETLQQWKKEVKQLVRQKERGDCCCGSRSSDTNRGLEGYSVQRQMHRYLSRKYILHMYRKTVAAAAAAGGGLGAKNDIAANHCPMAVVARQCSAWNVQLALDQAAVDYNTVYRQGQVVVEQQQQEQQQKQQHEQQQQQRQQKQQVERTANQATTAMTLQRLRQRMGILTQTIPTLQPPEEALAAPVVVVVGMKKHPKRPFLALDSTEERCVGRRPRLAISR
jgi:hypothetical protein